MDPDPPEQPPAQPPTTKAELKKRTLGTLMGCLAFVVLAFSPFVCAGIMAHQTEYQDPGAVFTLSLVKIGDQFSSLAYATLFALLFGGALGAWVANKGKWLWPVGLVVFLAVAALPAYFWYRDFVLVCVRKDGTAELRYFWPRPSVRADLTRIGAVEAVETDEMTDDNTGDGHFKWVLDVELDGVRYRSAPANFSSVVLEARNRLQRERLVYTLNALEKEGSAEPSNLAELQMQLGDASLALNRYAEAREAYARALAILEKTEGASSLRAGEASFGLGRACHNLKDYTRAEACYRRTLEILKANKIEGVHPEYQDVSMALIRLLEETGKDDPLLHLPRTPYTLMTDKIRQFGRDGARKKLDEMLEQRRKQREE
ncbi:MAG: tetratricopeptide repeat protein [Planctomycetes bacterium]|nr:tetratricopeptide repeat protein [Planctomycetota bacterium]